MKALPNTAATIAACAIDRNTVETAWREFQRQQSGWLAIPDDEQIPEWDRICSEFVNSRV